MSDKVAATDAQSNRTGTSSQDGPDRTSTKRTKSFRNVGSTYGPGPQNAVKPGEAAAMIGLSLSGMTGTEVAQRLGRSKQAVSRVLNSEEAKQARTLAKSLLTASASEFAENWIRAARKAADNGKHEASKEALVAIGAIEDKPRAEKQTGFVVKIGIALPGLGLPGGTPVESPVPALLEPAVVVASEESEDSND